MSRRHFLPNADLDTPEAALAIIRQAESFEPEWYLCPAGVWTIGYGLTQNMIPGINRSTVKRCTRDQAEDWMRWVIKTRFEPAIERAVRVPLTRNEFGAIVSLAYNCGAEAIAGSTLVRLLNAGDREGAADQFRLWCKSGGKVLPGLVKRRAAEKALFLTPDVEEPQETLRMIPGLQPLPVLPVEPLVRPSRPLTPAYVKCH